MSAPTLKPAKPRSPLGRFATLDRLATALTWVFWVTAVVTALQLILALTRSGGLANPVPKSQPFEGLPGHRGRRCCSTPAPGSSIPAWPRACTPPGTPR